MTLLSVVLAQVAIFAGGPTPIRCEANLGDTATVQVDGRALMGEHAILVRNEVCVSANRFAARPLLSVGPKPGSAHFIYDASASKAWSLFELLHETMHVKYQSYDEALTNCRAILAVRSFARALGSSRATANRVLAIDSFLTTMQPPEYQSRCAATGRTFTIRPFWRAA